MINMINKPIRIQFLGTKEDEPYLFHLTSALGQYKSGAGANLRKFDFISEIEATYKSKGITHIITTQEQLIPLLFNTASEKEQKLSNYAGSFIFHEKSGLYFLFINPLKQCMTINYGKFMLLRYISKITHPEDWLVPTKFSYNIITDSNFQAVLTKAKAAIAIAVDIETRPDLTISSCSYTIITQAGTETYVIPIPTDLSADELEFIYYYMRELNATDTPKIFQNGKYDCAYFQYYNIPIRSYLFDTQIAHHASYCELPKDLGILGAFYYRYSFFWKNEGDTDLYYYNALDTYYTAWVFLQWLKEKTAEATTNYLMIFPELHANFLSESTGLAVNYPVFREVLELHGDVKERKLHACKVNTGEINFNPGSSQQTKKVMDILGCTDLRNADEKAMNRAAFRHPFNHYIIDLIISYRKAAKLISTYLNDDKFFSGRLLYSLSPTTDTSRNRSAEHAFWTGFNIQNIPRGGGIKRYLEADEGFLLFEADYEQAESRDTAYITGDTVLIANVDNPERDFHKANASMFFGVDYKDVDKELRQLGKPINHGANYMMSDETLIDSMGLFNVFKAAARLGIPKFHTARQICKHLLSLFANTYPVVAHDYPRYIQSQVKTFGKLTNPYGFTRICFGDPIKNKEYLRSLVAFLPQSTNGRALGKAYVRVFNEVWKPNSNNFKLNAQIHDSILFQCRIGHEHLALKVKAIMEESSTVMVTDISGNIRELKVPVAVTSGGKSWFDSKED